MSKIKVYRIRKLAAEFEMPGDKSMSHRALMMAGFADGETRVSGFLPSEDCLSTLHAMQALGVEIDTISPTEFIIQGRRGKFLASGEPLDCGNSGTTMRLLTGLLSGQDFATKLFGDASLSKRPMKRVKEPLESMGAVIHCEGADNRPPIEVRGGKLKGIHYKTPVASAQLKSAILLAGLQAEGSTCVTEKTASRDHTERMLRHFHAHLAQKDLSVTVHGGTMLHGEDFRVPGDFSSAAFWLVAASAMLGARLKISNVGLNPTRTGLLTVLLRMGAQLRESVNDNATEPCGSLEILEGTRLKGTEIGGAEIPNVIDEIPIIAVAAALAEGRTVIKDAGELRVKESDRLAAIATNFRAFGVPIEETPDGLIIEGGAPLHAARVPSYGDHRIAMASAILGLFAEGASIIDDTDCIQTSYPTFEKHLAEVLDGDTASKFAVKWPFRKKTARPQTKKDPQSASPSA
ncbi:MAG: 3-phosphoshikimate 1-carboxyvinyltransferase [Candidatus Methylacidiphilales bacterium]|nr:3-phosphoshikimate 1-carboxyvinyltransferase [Candidatus Methylacidiphilales bacterium]